MKRALISFTLIALTASLGAFAYASGGEGSADCNRELDRTVDVILVGVGQEELAHVELMMHRLLLEHRITGVGHIYVNRIPRALHPSPDTSPNISIKHDLSKLDVLMLEDIRRDSILEMVNELPIEPIQLSWADYTYFARERPGQTTWANQLRNHNRRHYIAFKLRR